MSRSGKFKNRILSFQALWSWSEDVWISDTRRDVEKRDVAASTILYIRVDDVDRQASLVSPHTSIVEYLTLFIHERVRPYSGQDTGVWHGTRANVRFAQASSVSRYAEIAPWSINRLFGTHFLFQIVHVGDLLRVQVDYVEDVILRAQGVLFNDTLTFVDGVIGYSRACSLIFRIVILEISKDHISILSKYQVALNNP